MSIEFTYQGVKIDTFDDIFNKKVEQYKKIYGSDINISSDNPDGQRIGIESNAILDIQSFGLWLYSQIDPDFSQGQMLNVVSKFCGILRKPATQSTAQIQVEGVIDTVIPKDFEFKDTNSNIWLSTAETTYAAGGILNISVVAQEFGSVNAEIGSINDSNDVLLGIGAITNNQPAVIGNDEETDVEFRKRRNLSTENAAFSTVGSLYASLLDLEQVADVKIYENKTSVFNPTLQLDGHSIWIIVEGGDDNDIAETIILNKAIGCGEKGDSSGTYTEIIGANTLISTALFSRPTKTACTLTATITKQGGGLNPDLITDSIVGKQFEIGESIQITELYNSIYQTQDGLVVSNLTLNKTGTAPQSVVVNSGADEICYISNVVIL